MSNIILKHPTLNYAQDVIDICKPLKHLDITYFTHVRVDHQDNFSGISNNPEFAEHYLKNKYYNADIHMAKQNIFNEFVMWDVIELSGKTKTMDNDAKKFGVKHAFTIIEKDHDSKNFYHFANNSDSQLINQVYLANYDLLKLFILHFKEKINQSKLLSSAYDLTFGLDKKAEGYSIKSDNDLIIHDKNRNEFLQAVSLNDNSYNLTLCASLTIREKECLKHLVLGKSAREIAEILGLSKRTVEFYLANIKSKLYVNSKSKLIEIGIEYFQLLRTDSIL